MNILHICSYYDNVLFENLVHALRKNGMENEVYIFFPKEREQEDFKNKKENITLSYCYDKKDRWFFHIKHNKVRDDFLNKYRERIDAFDCIYAHSLFSNGYIAYTAKKQWGIPYIVMVQNTDLNVFFGYMKHLRKLGIDIMMNADKIIFASQAYVDTMTKKYISSGILADFQDKVTIIPYGIDDFYFQNQAMMEKKSDMVNVLSVGTICSNKNHLALVKAVKYLRKQGHNIKLTVIGRFQNKKIVEKLVKYDFVSCIDFIEKEQLIGFMQQANIFALASKKETFGLVYGEALSQGCPVLYSLGQGFDQQFEEGAVGYHVDAGDHRNIAGGIQKLLSKGIGSDVCMKNAEKFRWSNISQIYYDIFTKILEENRG